jgi:hypothetical protein
MRYNLHALRSDTLAHILASIGIASILRGKGRVGWDPDGRFPYVEADLDSTAIEQVLEDGITLLQEDCKAINSCYGEKKISLASGTSKGKKGRKKSLGDDEEQKIRGLFVSKLSRKMDVERQSMREIAVAMVSIVNSKQDISDKPRSMLGKTLLYQTVADDLVKFGAMKNRQGILDELSTPERLASWIANKNTSRARGVTGYDHVGNMLNAGINQSELGKAKRPNPIIELLAIEGLKCLPVTPMLGQNPRSRGMSKNDGQNLNWKMPIWKQPLSYYEIEDLVADGREFKTLSSGIVEVRTFDLIENGNVQMLRPA